MGSVDVDRRLRFWRSPPSDGLKGTIGGALRNSLLAVDPEWLIGVARLVTAIFAVLAIYLDPTQPTAFAHESQITLGFYVVFAMFLVLFPLNKPLDSPIHLITHLVDALVLGWLSLLTSELSSPFFSFLPFFLLAMTIRWGLWGAVLGAALLETLQIIVGLPDFRDGDSELNLFIMRSAYFMVAAVMLGYLGAYRERNRQRLAELADWPLEAITGDNVSWLRGLFKHAAQVLAGPRLLVVWRDHEIEAGSVAYWYSGDLRLVNIRNSAFWEHHDPDPVFDPKLFGSPDACRDEVAAILRDLPDGIVELPSADGFACSATFSSVRYRGRVFVINPACRPDECRPLTDIIAMRFGSELERLALMQQTADAARTEERARLARDLHDSILQDLTAASLKLKLLAKSVPDDVRAQLADVSSLVFSQQQRIRQYVEAQRSPDRRPHAALHQALPGLVKILREQWDCEIEMSLDPPDIEVPKWTHHEISQLVSEATANAVRHGKATRLRITLAEADGSLNLEFYDNGSGVQSDLEPNRPLSLTTRVADLGGHLTICRASPGFCLRIALPLNTGTP